MKYYVISGEASGDLHGANLIYHLKKNDPNSNFRAWGGELIEAQGTELVKHYKDLSFMGFLEVTLNLRIILANLKFCKKDILEFQPDAIILIDYPGFNMKIAKFAKSQKIPVYYYISPQLWAWNTNRVFDIKKYIRQLYCILPFEEEFYSRYDYKVNYLGHPILDAISNYKKTHDISKIKYKQNNRPLVALLPGSRLQELSRVLPKMIEVSEKFPQCDFVIAGIDAIDRNIYNKFILDSYVEVVYNDTYQIYSEADAALVSSGTATLEAALFNVPQVVCYKSSWFSYFIARILVKVKYISLVNLISNKEIVRELIQNDLTVSNIELELDRILSINGANKMLKKYEILRNLLGDIGASKRVANSIFNDLKLQN